MTNFHLQRYFCEYESKDKVVHWDSFIYVSEDDPEYFSDADDYSWPRPWEYYNKYRSIVLLGPPRQGKTIEFQYRCEQVENGFFLPLRKIPPGKEAEPASAFDQHSLEKWIVWLESENVGELFIDALDEGKLDAKRLIYNLTTLYQHYRTPIIHLPFYCDQWPLPCEGMWRQTRRCCFTGIF